MTPVPDSFVHYLAAWNEPDLKLIRGHLDRSVAPHVVFADPANHTVGPDALEAMIRAARQELPDAEYRRVSGVDGGHDRRYRYRWEVWINGALAVQGMDCTAVDEHGLIERLDGFFGEFPPLEADERQTESGRMSLRADTIERLHAYWRSWAEQPDDPDAVSVVLLGGERFVRAPDRLRAPVVAASPVELDALVALLGDDVERAVEARLAYIDDELRLVATEGVIMVDDDDARLEVLAAASDPIEWREASVDEPCEHRFGVVERNALSAVVTLQVWGDVIGHVGVFTAPSERRRGLASKVASAAVARARELHVVPQWRSRIGNHASERVADQLGFVPFGRQLFVRMKPQA